MNVDITPYPPFTDSTQRRQIARYTGPNPYDSTNGDVLDPADFRMGKIFVVLGMMMAEPGGAIYSLIFVPDSGANNDTPTLYWVDATSGLPVGNGIDLSGAIGTIEVIGQ